MIKLTFDSSVSWRFTACEFRRKVALLAAVCVVLVIGVGLARPAADGAAQPAEQQTSAEPAPLAAREKAPAAGTATASEGQADASHQPAAEAHGAPAEHGSSIWSVIARLFNFAILAGTLVYFLRTPLAQYMRDRAGSIRQDLVTAKQLKIDAQAQLDEIDRRMRALPGEIEELKSRGAREIATEEARIRQHAEAERTRLLAETRRDLDLQLRTARRDLVEHAAALAVALAAERIKDSITGEDHARLADVYIRDLSRSREAS